MTVRELPVLFVVLRNGEYAILKSFAVLEQTPGVPGLDLPGIDSVALALGYGCAAAQPTTAAAIADEVAGQSGTPADGLTSPHPQKVIRSMAILDAVPPSDDHELFIRLSVCRCGDDSAVEELDAVLAGDRLITVNLVHAEWVNDDGPAGPAAPLVVLTVADDAPMDADTARALAHALLTAADRRTA